MSNGNTMPPKNNPQPYKTARAQLGTGDLVFLHGTSPAGVMIENVEKTLNWPPYSHVGMVIKDVDNLYFWDAPGGGNCFPDPYSDDPDNRIYGKKVHTGCRVSVLDDLLAYYITKTDAGGFWIRQLASGVSEAQFNALRIFINRVDGLLFPAGVGPGDPAATGLGESYLAGQTGSSIMWGNYFCSQLVTDTYMHMGLIEMDDLPPNGYSPAALGIEDPSTVMLRLVPTAKLGDTFFADWGNGPTGGGVACNQNQQT
jgi:hypothetical protein